MITSKPQSNEYEGIPKVSGSGTFTSKYRVIGLRQEGLDHAERQEKPCQDNFNFGRSDRFIWLAVADGVGSETHSQFGSRVACDAVAQFFYAINNGQSGLSEPDGSGDIGLALLENAQREVEHHARACQIERRAFSSTLQVVLFDLALDKVTYAALGDGNCIATRFDGAARVVGHKRQAPSIGTPNLGSADAWEWMHSETIGTVSEVEYIILFSDGLDRIFIKPKTADPVEAVGADGVSFVKKVLRRAQDEFQALNLIGKFFNAAEYEDRMRDDKSLLAFANLGLSPVADVNEQLSNPMALNPLEVAPAEVSADPEEDDRDQTATPESAESEPNHADSKKVPDRSGHRHRLPSIRPISAYVKPAKIPRIRWLLGAFSFGAILGVAGTLIFPTAFGPAGPLVETPLVESEAPEIAVSEPEASESAASEPADPASEKQSEPIVAEQDVEVPAAETVPPGSGISSLLSNADNIRRAVQPGTDSDQAQPDQTDNSDAESSDAIDLSPSPGPN